VNNLRRERRHSLVHGVVCNGPANAGASLSNDGGNSAFGTPVSQIGVSSPVSKVRGGSCRWVAAECAGNRVAQVVDLPLGVYRALF
jgi:hypothetical protein